MIVSLAELAEQSVIAATDDQAGQVVFACQKDLMEAAGCAFLPYSA